MKKNNLFRVVTLAIALSTLIYACDNKDETKGYSQEESKDNLDQSLTSIANELSALSELKSVTVMDSLMEMDMELPLFEDLIQPVSEVEGTSLDEMKDAIENGVVNITLDQLTKWGTYTYNFNTEIFDFTEGEIGTFVFNMPSAESMTTNDMEIKLFVEFTDIDFNQEIVYNNEYYDDYGYLIEEQDTVGLTLKDIFTDITFTVKQDAKLLIGYDFTLTLDDEGMPNKMETALTLEEFKISTVFDASAPEEKASHSTSFSKNGNELIGYTVILEGDLTTERIQEINEELTMTYENDEVPSDEFLSSLDYALSAEIRFDDFVIKGIVDGSKLYDTYNTYGEKELESKEEAQSMVDMMNNAMSLTLKDKDGSSVGQYQIYIAEDEDSGNYISSRFKFADGTYMSPDDEGIDSELDELFGDFLDELMSLAEEFGITEETTSSEF